MSDIPSQLGIAGLTLAILFFVVRYFVQAMTSKDQVNQDLTNKFIDLSRGAMESQDRLAKAIDVNTASNKQNTDNISKLVLKALKKEDKK